MVDYLLYMPFRQIVCFTIIFFCGLIINILSKRACGQFNKRRDKDYFSHYKHDRRAQFRIQQMVFMIVALVFFFVLVGIFFIGYQFRSVSQNFESLQREQAISFLKIMRNMPEFGYFSRDSRANSVCLDLDKLQIVSGNIGDYFDLLPVASIKVLKAFSSQIIQCPGENCNYYKIYDSKQKNIEEQEIYTCLCTKKYENYIAYDKCELGRVIVGVIKK
jgi:uncharacterized membrane protein